jgi:hypothetical protein
MTSRWQTFAWLAAVFGCGAIDAAWWAVIAGAAGLTFQRMDLQDTIVAKYAPAIGGLAAWGLFSGLAFAGYCFTCAGAFAVGKLLAAVVA